MSGAGWVSKKEREEKGGHFSKGINRVTRILKCFGTGDQGQQLICLWSGRG